MLSVDLLLESDGKGGELASEVSTLGDLRGERERGTNDRKRRRSRRDRYDTRLREALRRAKWLAYIDIVDERAQKAREALVA